MAALPSLFQMIHFFSADTSEELDGEKKSSPEPIFTQQFTGLEEREPMFFPLNCGEEKGHDDLLVVYLESFSDIFRGFLDATTLPVFLFIHRPDHRLEHGSRLVSFNAWDSKELCCVGKVVDKKKVG